MERDRGTFVSNKQPKRMSRRVARIASDERLAKLEARVAAGRAPQWKLDLVRSVRATVETNPTPPRA
jgi:hypothetical protein